MFLVNTKIKDQQQLQFLRTRLKTKILYLTSVSHNYLVRKTQAKYE